MQVACTWHAGSGGSGGRRQQAPGCLSGRFCHNVPHTGLSYACPGLGIGTRVTGSTVTGTRVRETRGGVRGTRVRGTMVDESVHNAHDMFRSEHP